MGDVESQRSLKAESFVGDDWYNFEVCFLV